MNTLENKNIFLDLGDYINKGETEREYLPPTTIYSLEDLEVILLPEYPEDFYQPIFWKDEVILVSGKNDSLYFYTCKPYLIKDLSKHGEVICLHEADYITHLLFIIMITMAGGSIAHRPFLKYKGEFIAKMIYFLDLPFDNFTLKKMGVNPDLSATTLHSFKL